MMVIFPALVFFRIPSIVSAATLQSDLPAAPAFAPLPLPPPPVVTSLQRSPSTHTHLNANNQPMEEDFRIGIDTFKLPSSRTAPPPSATPPPKKGKGGGEDDWDFKDAVKQIEYQLDPSLRPVVTTPRIDPEVDWRGRVAQIADRLEPKAVTRRPLPTPGPEPTMFPQPEVQLAEKKRQEKTEEEVVDEGLTRALALELEVPEGFGKGLAAGLAPVAALSIGRQLLDQTKAARRGPRTPVEGMGGPPPPAAPAGFPPPTPVGATADTAPAPAPVTALATTTTDEGPGGLVAATTTGGASTGGVVAVKPPGAVAGANNGNGIGMKLMFIVAGLWAVGIASSLYFATDGVNAGAPPPQTPPSAVTEFKPSPMKAPATTQPQQSAPAAPAPGPSIPLLGQLRLPFLSGDSPPPAAALPPERKGPQGVPVVIERLPPVKVDVKAGGPAPAPSIRQVSERLQNLPSLLSSELDAVETELTDGQRQLLMLQSTTDDGQQQQQQQQQDLVSSTITSSRQVDAPIAPHGHLRGDLGEFLDRAVRETKMA